MPARRVALAQGAASLDVASGPPTGMRARDRPRMYEDASIAGYGTKAAIVLSAPPRIGQCSNSISMGPESQDSRVRRIDDARERRQSATQPDVADWPRAARSATAPVRSAAVRRPSGKPTSAV